jgi:hypothetical protein
VLTAREHGFPHDIAAPAEAGWQEMQAELAQLSSTSTQIVVDGVGHCIHCEQPAVVIDAIRRVVKAVDSNAGVLWSNEDQTHSGESRAVDHLGSTR